MTWLMSSSLEGSTSFCLSFWFAAAAKADKDARFVRHNLLCSTVWFMPIIFKQLICEAPVPERYLVPDVEGEPEGDRGGDCKRRKRRIQGHGVEVRPGAGGGHGGEHTGNYHKNEKKCKNVKIFFAVHP